MRSLLDFGNSEEFRKKLMLRNLVPYSKSPYGKTPPFTYEVSPLNDYSVIDSPDYLIDTKVLAAVIKKLALPTLFPFAFSDNFSYMSSENAIHNLGWSLIPQKNELVDFINNITWEDIKKKKENCLIYGSKICWKEEKGNITILTHYPEVSALNYDTALSIWLEKSGEPVHLRKEIIALISSQKGKQVKKEYTPIKSYKPSGNLVYDDDLLNKIEGKFFK
jgi:hypothetical protein